MSKKICKKTDLEDFAKLCGTKVKGNMSKARILDELIAQLNELKTTSLGTKIISYPYAVFTIEWDGPKQLYEVGDYHLQWTSENLRITYKNSNGVLYTTFSISELQINAQVEIEAVKLSTVSQFIFNQNLKRNIADVVKGPVILTPYKKNNTEYLIPYTQIELDKILHPKKKYWFF
jgi:hypothetical protein